ncbi:phospholipid-binding lipoprotein MlaA [Ralstonia sp. 25mfcol4.1]|uniref:MlaA family lipoprotein n=1 Tax=Burkholderiaceae TaxID=119060 RepID=UPI00088FA7D6|nr:VacJ family lipoprotein [Ralstonia sp. 25mfcol4.1]SDP16103.1 phospholipid-binding lipoprotein MlaA [Ralstonia sp. 25mfcol4.1]
MLSRLSLLRAAAPESPRLATALAAASLTLLATGCATGPNANPADPLEPMNRVVFTVNDKADTYVAQPLAKGYKAVTPEPARLAVTNFFNNFSDVGNFANNVLQGRPVEAVETMMRVAVNTVLGIGGLIDVATAAGMPRHSTDFGLTLGTWGVPAGPYLVLPLFGPSSIRDGVGVAGSIFLDPAHYFDTAWRYSMFGINVVNTRTNMLGATDLLSQAALDKYAFVRDAYTQRRQYLLTGGGDTLPTYDEDEESSPSAPGGKAAPKTPEGEARPDTSPKPETPATPAPAPGMAK